MTQRIAGFAAVIASLALTHAPVQAQPAAANLQLALDKPVTLTIEDATILGVFAKLSAATGIQFVVPEETLEFLPYGDQTRLRVRLENATPRNALSPVLRPQALRWEIRGQHIEILPTEALYRFCRRPGYNELHLLGVMNSVELGTTTKAGDPIEQLRKAAARPDLRVIFYTDADKAAAYAQAEKALPGTAVDWLDMLCHGRQWTWRLAGDRILIVDAISQVRRQLQRQVSLRYQNAELMQVLRDLAGKAHLGLSFAPGVMNYLPSETRTNFGMIMADASIEQALQRISGETGLVFTYTPDGIHVDASERLKQGLDATRTRPRSAFYVKLSLPAVDGASVEVFLPADQLPEELQKAIEAEKAKLVENLGEKYGVPTTRP